MSKLHPLSRREHQRRAFTLIELVVVLIIVAALAGLLIPQVGMLGRSSDMAVSAKSQQDVAQNIQLFFALQKRYPQGMDSLLDTTGIVYAPNGNGDTQTRGLPATSANGINMHLALVPATLDNAAGSYLRSFTRSGFDWVYDHNLDALHANDSTLGQPPRVFAGTGANALVAELISPNSGGTATGSSTQLLSLLAPNGLRPGERIVALGFGQRNSALGITALSAPVYAGNAGSYYGYYVAFFKIYPNGERATLVGVTDSYGRTPVYTQQQFNESLPDGQRQG
jgi:prepilin-type N-terminal cleavage/methylation domain-containing protein